MGAPPITSNSILEDRLAHLLGELCVEWGFCLPPEDVQRISNADRLTADEFANEVLTAEGFVAEYEVKWQRDLRRRFVTEFGGAVVSTEDFG